MKLDERAQKYVDYNPYEMGGGYPGHIIRGIQIVIELLLDIRKIVKEKN